jgi:hypothetical protein
VHRLPTLLNGLASLLPSVGGGQTVGVHDLSCHCCNAGQAADAYDVLLLLSERDDTWSATLAAAGVNIVDGLMAALEVMPLTTLAGPAAFHRACRVVIKIARSSLAALLAPHEARLAAGLVRVCNDAAAALARGPYAGLLRPGADHSSGSALLDATSGLSDVAVVIRGTLVIVHGALPGLRVHLQAARADAALLRALASHPALPAWVGGEIHCHVWYLAARGTPVAWADRYSEPEHLPSSTSRPWAAR